MANSSTQTQIESEGGNTRIFAQGTGVSELSSPVVNEPGVSTNDALMSPFPSMAPAQQNENAAGGNSSPRPRYYSQGQNSGSTQQQTGVIGGQEDQITSYHTNQHPVFSPEPREGALHNQGPNNAESDEKANYYVSQGIEHAPSQRQAQAQPQTAKDRYNTKNPESSQHWNNPHAGGVPRPVNNLVVPLDGLRDSPGQVDCPRCQQQVVTRVERVAGTTVTAWAAILCLLTGICCAWIPCVIDDCKDCEHFCTNCGLRLATYTAGGHSHVYAVTAKPPGAQGQIQNQTAQQSENTTKEIPRDMSGQYYQPQQQMQHPTQYGDPQQADSRPLGQSSYIGPPVEVQGSLAQPYYTPQNAGTTGDNVEMGSSSEKKLEQSLGDKNVDNSGDRAGSQQ